MESVDWLLLEESLFQQSKRAIDRFAVEHSKESCSFLAYAWIGEGEEISLCIDISDSAIRSAQENEQEILTQRLILLRLREAWKVARHFLNEPKVNEYAPGVDLFKYGPYVDIRLEHWDEVINQQPYPAHRQTEDDYLSGNIRILIWKCIERLITENVLDVLQLASPFHLGYQFHDEEIIVLRILNWPSLK